MLLKNLRNICVKPFCYFSVCVCVSSIVCDDHCVLQGALFFDGLLQKLQTAYQFKLEDYMDGMAIRARPLRKTVQQCSVWLCVHLTHVQLFIK